MPRECTWITAREQASSKGGGGVPDIQILGDIAFGDHLASEAVVLTFFQGVSMRMRMVAVTMESISSGEIGTRHWTGK